MNGKLELSPEWAKYSDLSVEEAAFILYGLDPKDHFIRYGADEPYTLGFDDRDVSGEIAENYPALRSALRAGKLAITHGCATDIDIHGIYVTKKSFLEWCKEIHRTDVVSAFKNASNLATLCTDELLNVRDWKEEARRLADEEFERDTELGTRDTLAHYAERVMNRMQALGIHSPRGRIDKSITVQRDALQGDKWWARKRK